MVNGTRGQELPSSRPRRGRVRDPILRSKITTPALPPWVVPRLRLERRIAQGIQGPLTSITGAPGAGKTLAIASWAASHHAGPIAWVTVDGYDNSSEVFWPTLEIMFRLAVVLHGMGDDAGATTLVTEIDDILIALPDGAEAQLARLEQLRQRLGTDQGTEPRGEGQGSGLTHREMTVLRMFRGSMSVAEIAQELELSSNTVKTHTRAIYRKLGVSARAAAVTRARELGLL